MAPPSLQLSEISRELDLEKDHLVIVYEYVPEGHSDLDSMQRTIDFIWRAGSMFFNSARDVNWESNVLLDLSEIAGPYQISHSMSVHAKHDAKFLVEKKEYPDYRWKPGRLPDVGSVPRVVRFVYSRFVWSHEQEAWLEKWNEERRRKGEPEVEVRATLGPVSAYPRADSGGDSQCGLSDDADAKSGGLPATQMDSEEGDGDGNCHHSVLSLRRLRPRKRLDSGGEQEAVKNEHDRAPVKEAAISRREGLRPRKSSRD